ncbi:hypothetical protein BDQ17DRAFT_1429583 [Cyathus striatus]|nr:hypothetical protein BDQ17DRAFT_1429583 [Cyathus striatus]
MNKVRFGVYRSGAFILGVMQQSQSQTLCLFVYRKIASKCESEMSDNIKETSKPDPSPPMTSTGHDWWHTVLLVPPVVSPSNAELGTIPEPEPDSEQEKLQGIDHQSKLVSESGIAGEDQSKDSESDSEDCDPGDTRDEEVLVTGEVALSEPQSEMEAKLSSLQAKFDLLEEVHKRMESDLETVKHRTEEMGVMVKVFKTIYPKFRLGGLHLFLGVAVFWILARYIPPFYFALLLGAVYFLYREDLK